MLHPPSKSCIIRQHTLGENTESSKKQQKHSPKELQCATTTRYVHPLGIDLTHWKELELSYQQDMDAQKQLDQDQVDEIEDFTDDEALETTEPIECGSLPAQENQTNSQTD
jgi:hypothetical protein